MLNSNEYRALLAEAKRRKLVLPSPAARGAGAINWLRLKLREPHEEQRKFIESTAKRKVVRAGRRGGKTVGVARLALGRFRAGRRQLYAAPTSDQLDAFWFEVTTACADLTQDGTLYKNETEHVIEVPGTKQRIRAKTAWSADTLRGDYADDLYLDEFQLMSEDAWDLVGAPMLLDNDGDAVFVYTPPSLHSTSRSKAKDKRHAAKMFKKAEKDTTGRWATFHFGSNTNPFISGNALLEIVHDMTQRAIRQEIDAIDLEDAPGALWTFDTIENARVETAPQLTRIVVPIDPSASSTDSSDEAGIVPVGRDAQGHGYVLKDYTLRGTPAEWATKAICAYVILRADKIVGEGNNGGEMVETVIKGITIETVRAELIKMGQHGDLAIAGKSVPYAMVWASRGKATRAEPASALYQQGKIHHVGPLPLLEEEMTGWVPGTGKSPNRVDSLVWGLTELKLINSGVLFK